MITKQDVVRDLEVVVKEFGADFIYELPPEIDIKASPAVCLYCHVDKPGCIVGQLLYKWGVPLSQLSKMDGMGEFDFIVNDTCLLDEVGLHFTTAAIQLLMLIQGKQDRKETWGSILEWAKSNVVHD